MKPAKKGISASKQNAAAQQAPTRQMNAARQMSAAIARVPGQSNEALKAVLANARRMDAAELIAACELELGLRGSLNLTSEQALKSEEIRARVEGKSLAESIEIGFRESPPDEDEAAIITWLHENPAGLFQDALKQIGRKDLSLVIGHLIYNRFGFFRAHIESKTQSDLLITRQGSDKGVRYTLRDEASAAFRTLGLIN